jgi:hypothetical protein
VVRFGVLGASASTAIAGSLRQKVTWTSASTVNAGFLRQKVRWGSKIRGVGGLYQHEYFRLVRFRVLGATVSTAISGS